MARDVVGRPAKVGALKAEAPQARATMTAVNFMVAAIDVSAKMGSERLREEVVGSWNEKGRDLLNLNGGQQMVG
jgi:hypothetical protein